MDCAHLGSCENVKHLDGGFVNKNPVTSLPIEFNTTKARALGKFIPLESFTLQES